MSPPLKTLPNLEYIKKNTYPNANKPFKKRGVFAETTPPHYHPHNPTHKRTRTYAVAPFEAYNTNAVGLVGKRHTNRSYIRKRRALYAEWERDAYAGYGPPLAYGMWGPTRTRSSLFSAVRMYVCLSVRMSSVTIAGRRARARVVEPGPLRLR